MAEETKTTGPAIPPVQTTGGSGDARLDAILAKKSRNETLDARERGYLAYKNYVSSGTYKPGIGRSPGAAAVAKQIVAQPQSNNPLLADTAQAQTPVLQRPAVSIDPAIVVKTTLTVLGGIDSITQRLIANKARRIGADANGTAELVRSVAMPAEIKAVVSETCPDALLAMGFDLTSFPVYAFFGAITTYAVTVGSAISKLSELEQNRIEAEREAAKKNAPASK